MKLPRESDVSLSSGASKLYLFQVSKSKIAFIIENLQPKSGQWKLPAPEYTRNIEWKFASKLFERQQRIINNVTSSMTRKIGVILELTRNPRSCEKRAIGRTNVLLEQGVSRRLLMCPLSSFKVIITRRKLLSVWNKTKTRRSSRRGNQTGLLGFD